MFAIFTFTIFFHDFDCRPDYTAKNLAIHLYFQYKLIAIVYRVWYLFF